MNIVCISVFFPSILFCFVFYVSCSLDWPQIHYVAEDDLELPILSLLPKKGTIDVHHHAPSSFL